MRIKDYMSLLSKYRTPIMGICILDVLFGHTGMYFMGPLNYLLKCYWTIDVFFFFSGMGAFYSLTKNPDTLEFYKRRLIRIYVPYLPVILAYCLCFCIFYRSAYTPLVLIRQVFGNILMLGWINGLENQLNWYPQVIVLVYLFTPALFALVKSFNGNRKKMAATLGFFVLIQICFLGNNYLVAASRLISFVMGLIASELACEDADIKLNVPLLLISAFIGHVLLYLGQHCDLDLVWQYGTAWYPAIIAIPGTMLVMCRIISFFSSKKLFAWLMWLINISGVYSFEVFLVHLLFYYSVPTLIHFTPRTNPEWAAFALAAGVLSLAYGKLMDKLRKKLK